MQKRKEKETEKNIENHQNKMTDRNNRKKRRYRATRKKKKYGNTKPLFVNNHPKHKQAEFTNHNTKYI